MRRADLLAPRDLEGLAAALRIATADTRMVAGGTDLMLELRAGTVRPDLLIDLAGLLELRCIHRERDRIRIGALTTFDQMQDNAMLAAEAGCLARAAAQVGSAQIRNLATLGGNVVNASPCSDTIPALLVLGSDVGVLNRSGTIERRPLQNLLLEAGRTALRRDEALIDFSFAPLSRAARSAFAKIGARSSVTVANLNAALVVSWDDRQRVISDARIAFGSIAPVAFIDEEAVASLRGKPLDANTAASFAAACARTVERSIRGRGSLPYKRRAALGLAEDLLTAVAL
jgi:CO/xanthine dehydrogenase FAD-binding subunit